MSDRHKRQAQQERDELADEIVNSSTGKSVSFHITTHPLVFGAVNVVVAVKC